MSRDLSPLLPAAVGVVFPGRRCAGYPHQAVPRSYRSDMNLSAVTLTNTDVDPQPLGVNGTARVLRDTAAALYTPGTADPTNKAALDALAARVAQDWYDWRGEGFDLVYEGICAVAPSALNDVIEWRYDAEACTTRVTSAAWDEGVEELAHMDPAVSGCVDSHTPDTTVEKGGVRIDVPGGTAGQSLWGVLTLEDGRLSLAYDQTASLPCGCVTSTGNVTITVFGCNNVAYPGVPVAVTNNGSGAALAGSPFTTDSNGQVNFTITSGQWTATATAPSTRFFQQSTTINFSSGNQSLSIHLQPTNLYGCCSAAGLFPLKKTLTITTPDSTISMLDTSGQWSCTETVVRNTCDFGTHAVSLFWGWCGLGSDPAQNVLLNYNICNPATSCSPVSNAAGGGVSTQGVISNNGSGTIVHGVPTTCQTLTVTSFSPPPAFSVSGTVSGSGSSGTFTITE